MWELTDWAFWQVGARAAVSYSWSQEWEREKGHCGQCFLTCMCALTPTLASRESEETIYFAILLQISSLMARIQDRPVITGGSPYCQGDFHSRLWFLLWYYWGSSCQSSYPQAALSFEDAKWQAWGFVRFVRSYHDLSEYFLMLRLTHCITVSLLQIHPNKELSGLM